MSFYRHHRHHHHNHHEQPHYYIKELRSCPITAEKRLYLSLVAQACSLFCPFDFAVISTKKFGRIPRNRDKYYG